ncbi:hypothetical protein LA080_004030 [Diaporthe eres]|uniref:Mid2 domain-containing protein n=1 Tax=Diaporthe vaccinii TaxID=105482 RepID=A0ABR4DZM8_9PEZI|nr:hypothetical protein LA080_004030 [Diaporthe eres]
MGWLHYWMARKTDPRDGPQYRVASDDIHDGFPAVELRDDRGNRRGNGGNGNRHNGGRRGDSAEEQGGDRGKGKGGDGDNNKNNDNKDDGGKKKPSDSSKSTEPPSSVTTTVVSVEPPTTVTISSATLSSILITPTEISTMTTQTEGSAAPTSFTISITTSVPASSSSPMVTSSSTSVIPTTVLPTPPSTSTSPGSTGAISSSELSTGAKAGIAIAALSAFALVLGALYICWRRGSSRTRRPIGIQPETSGAQGSLAQGAVSMAQTGRRSVQDDTGAKKAVDTSSWRTWHPYRPPSAQSNTEATAADLLEPPAPAFSRSTQDARRTLNTWETSSEPDSSAADRFSATALATYLSPAPTRPRRIGGEAQV